MIQRRSFLTSLAAALCAPAIIRTPGLLMPVRVQRGLIGPDWRELVQGIDLRAGAVNYVTADGMVFAGPMTATEVSWRQAEARPRLAAMAQAIQIERERLFLGPLIARTTDLLAARGLIPPPP